MSAIPTRPCSKCGAQIGWVLTSNGKRMPIDVTPNEAGNVYVTMDRGKLVGTVAMKGDKRPVGVAFVPHFATCAALNRGRKKAPAKPAKPPPPEPPPSLDL